MLSYLFLFLLAVKALYQNKSYTGCPKKKYTAQNRYNIQTTNDNSMKETINRQTIFQL